MTLKLIYDRECKKKKNHKLACHIPLNLAETLLYERCQNTSCSRGTANAMAIQGI